MNMYPGLLGYSSLITFRVACIAINFALKMFCKRSSLILVLYFWIDYIHYILFFLFFNYHQFESVKRKCDGKSQKKKIKIAIGLMIGEPITINLL